MVWTSSMCVAAVVTVWISSTCRAGPALAVRIGSGTAMAIFVTTFDTGPYPMLFSAETRMLYSMPGSIGETACVTGRVPFTRSFVTAMSALVPASRVLSVAIAVMSPK